MPDRPTFYILDAFSLIFQVFHAIPEMTGPAGQPTQPAGGKPPATADDGFEEEREIHELTLFGDEAYRAAFAAASLAPEVVPSPMEDRDRYVAVAS